MVDLADLAPALPSPPLFDYVLTTTARATYLSQSAGTGLTAGIPDSLRGAASGVATLDAASRLPVGQLPTDAARLSVANTFASLLTANGGAVITPAATGSVGAIVRGLVGQTADLQQWQNSAGTMLAKVDSLGRVAVYPNATDPLTLVDSSLAATARASSTSAAFFLAAPDSTSAVLSVRGAVGSTGTVAEFGPASGSNYRILFTGESEQLNNGSGILLRSLNGTRYRITVADNGAITSTAAP